MAKYTFFNYQQGMKKIYSAEELCEKVRDTVNYYEDLTTELQNSVREAHEKIQEKIKKEYEKQLLLSYGSFSSEKEYKAFCDFKKKHDKCAKPSSAIPGYIIQPFYTSLGKYTKVTCPVCGESIEIVDYDTW